MNEQLSADSLLSDTDIEMLIGGYLAMSEKEMNLSIHHKKCLKALRELQRRREADFCAIALGEKS